MPRTKEEVKHRLNELAANKDYAGMVAFCKEIGSNAATNEEAAAKDQVDDHEVEAVTEYFKELIEKDINDKEISAQSAEILEGFLNENCRQLAEASVGRHKTATEYSRRIQNGEFEELKYYKDDKKFADNLGDQMANNFSPDGKNVELLNQVYNLVYGCASQTDFEVNGQLVKNYVDDKRFNYVKEAFEKEAFDNIPKEKLEDKIYIRDLAVDIQKHKSIDVWPGGPSYKVKDKLPEDGSSIFAEIPDVVKKIGGLSDEELLIRDYELRRDQHYIDNPETENADMAKKVKPLIEKMEQMDDDDKKSKEYKDLYAELINFSKLGTTKFRRFGDNSDEPEPGQFYNDEKTAKTHKAADNAFRRLNSSLYKYRKIDPEFAKEVDGFIWEQKLVNKKFLDTYVSNTVRDAVDKELKLRDLEDKEIDLRKVSDIKQKEFEGPNGKYQQALDKMKNAKLFGRGSGEFNEVNKLLKRFGKKYERMAETERLMEKNGRADDAYANKIMKKVIEELREDVAELREANADYFKHKRIDGQWKKGTNKNADDRIAAVTFVDELMDAMDKMLEMKQAGVQRVIDREKQEEEQIEELAENHVENQPQPEPQVENVPDLEQEKVAFADVAARTYLQNKYKEDLDKYFADHPDLNEQQRQSVIDNTASVEDYVKEMLPQMKDNEHFKRFMDGITDQQTLDQYKAMAKQNGGAKIYGAINQAAQPQQPAEQRAPAQEESFTIQAQLKSAQDEIEALDNNANAENIAKPLSQIITCYKIMVLQKSGTFTNIKKEEFDKIEQSATQNNPAFKEMLKRSKTEELVNQATNDKGQNLFANYQHIVDAIAAEKKIKAENNRKVDNPELEKPKTMNNMN